VVSCNPLEATQGFEIPRADATLCKLQTDPEARADAAVIAQQQGDDIGSHRRAHSHQVSLKAFAGLAGSEESRGPPEKRETLVLDALAATGLQLCWY
jgi:hypothetical protein